MAAFEVALEGAGQAIGLYAELIAGEDARAEPDVGAIAKWRAEQRGWAARRRGLRPEDGAEIDAIYSEGEVLLAEPDETPRCEPVLDAAENERIFRERIVPDELTGTPQEQPILVIVAGQPGDGKAVVTALIEGVLSRHGRQPVTISPDRYQHYWPLFRTPLDEEPTSEGYLSTDSRRWTTKATSYARSHRFDVVMESPLLSPGDVEQAAQEFKSAGYRVEVAILAVPEAASRLGVLDRHIRALEVYGYGRLADPAMHDSSYHRVLDTAEAIDRPQYVDEVAVLRPDGQIIHAGNGRWQQESSAAEAVERERKRPWTAAESREFLEAVAEIRRIGRSAPIEWIQREAADGAKLVTSLAKPHLHPDAVTFHVATAGVVPPDA
ncbi:zeta toxin family protein [Kribbella sp. NPDC023972]|uniref:zeta toxin family protein n=1 Tax=Kribbella sp. NPDC023972 TaxID=3154795 RepID=UPI0033F25576